MPAYVHSVNVAAGSARPRAAGRLRRTAIDKRPVDAAACRARARRRRRRESPTPSTTAGATRRSTRSPARTSTLGADCWVAACTRAVRREPHHAGIDVNDALVGERWRIGEALLEVCSVRIPCRVFASCMESSGGYAVHRRRPPGPLSSGRRARPGGRGRSHRGRATSRPRRDRRTVFRAMTTGRTCCRCCWRCRPWRAISRTRRATVAGRTYPGVANCSTLLTTIRRPAERPSIIVGTRPRPQPEKEAHDRSRHRRTTQIAPWPSARPTWAGCSSTGCEQTPDHEAYRYPDEDETWDSLTWRETGDG